ncbi:MULTISPECIES: Ohr family peroxiredoxin [unclassified Rhizobium]|jgi:Ohr subfamily peroxiredoxin|uniref:Ohr family peroxiredoxin n=1 Tax=unclassified Rhizobium TaxID=2613769 RepID=UPI00161F6D14|nr:MULTISPECIES: Ohr family peroxiredoxin [unclassified Rhizobium]MBB3541279.1 Ohr subfamily peroxiredoxin [Rhizobium sp. BK399]MCS3740004.1 Ohr subfamily peroxiredoxin [Rhizobium sp. BK661]MCS4092046.1 Ohr subfamily peroxiredoxin [Rhizobium sp. BK176]
MTEKLLFSGKTHNKGGRDGFTRSGDGELNLQLSQPHPAAEHLFGAAWSACFIGAIELAASQRKIKLPVDPEIDTEIDLNVDGGSFFLRARLNVSVPGIERGVAEELMHAAHEICPYSKATRGNIDVSLTLV